MKHKYPILIFWSDEDEGYIATIYDLPGCSAWGETQSDALEAINTAVEASLEAIKKSGK